MCRGMGRRFGLGSAADYNVEDFFRTGRDIPLGGFKVTGSGQPTQSGELLRYQALGPGALPVAAGTQFLATNVTLKGYGADDNGRTILVTSQTATPRLTGEYWPGTKIRGRLSSLTLGVASAAPTAGGAALLVRRDDGRMGSFGFNISGAGIMPVSWTGKDSYLATKTANGGVYPKEGWFGFGDDGTGNVIFETSIDGVTYSTLNPPESLASFFGTGGNITGVGWCVFTASSTGLYGGRLSRYTITP